MPSVNMPPIVNDQGNINVHINEGVQIPLTVQDDNGVEIDASAMPLFFKVGAFSKALSADPNNAEGRLLELTPTEIATIMHGAQFRVVDETIPSLPQNKWEGRFYKRG